MRKQVRFLSDILLITFCAIGIMRILSTFKYGRCNMSKYYRFIKLCCSGILLILAAVYVTIWEPYCFFNDVIHSNGISELGRSKLYSSMAIRNASHGKNLIAILTASISSKLLSRLQLLDENFLDNYSSPLLIMHSTTLSQRELVHVSAIMKRPVLFLNIANAFRLFPVNFDPCKAATSYRVRGKWNYLLMIRFWFKLIFELPQLKEYEYIMRLDDDSQMTGKWLNVFDEMRAKNAVYFANNVDVDLEEQLPGTMKLKQITDKYIQQNNIAVKQRDMFDGAFHNGIVNNYYNNFEVSKTKFFQREDVRRWVDAIDATQGIFKYRWGDAVLRYLTLAIFAQPNEVLHRLHYNLSYCHKC
jgi:hypothetical protein